MNLKLMVYFVKKFLDRLKIGNANVENTMDLSKIKFVKIVLLKLLNQEFEDTEWGISN